MLEAVEKFIKLDNLEKMEFKWTGPGIRSQLVYKDTGAFVSDFIIEEELSSIHVLNYSSPGWTAAFAMADHIVEKHVDKVLMSHDSYEEKDQKPWPSFLERLKAKSS